MPTGQTKLENLIDPEVMADFIDAKLEASIRFTGLATVNRELEGRPGSVLTVPAWKYIGDATEIAEGEAIPLDKLETSEKTMTIKKAGKGVEITDESALSGMGDPIGQANQQLLTSIANKVDNDLLTALSGATQTYAAVGGLTVANLDGALQVFNDEDDAQVVLIANPADAAVLRADAGKQWLGGTELGANRVVTGAFGEILGAETVRSKKLTKGTAYLVKVGALVLMLKRNAQVETDRDIIKKTTVITADEHYGAYLFDPTKAVKINISDAPDAGL